MIPASPILTHMAGGSTTLARCWKVTLTNGTVLGYTAHDADLTFGGVTHAASTGFMASDAESQTRLAVDNLEAAGFLREGAVSRADIDAGLWDFAQVQIYIVNFRNLAQAPYEVFSGRIGAISQDRGMFRAELRGPQNAYSQTIVRTCQPGCRTTLGSTRCGVDLAAYTVTGTLSGASADGLVLSDPARTEPGPVGGKAITGITQAALPVVTCAGHGFVPYQAIYIAEVLGMVEINGQYYTVKTVPSADSFTLADTDTTAFGAYTSGGSASPQGDAGYFAHGKITMTSGASAGMSMEVKAYSPGTITLHLPLPRGAAAGDGYSLHAGCGGRYIEDCRGRFNNGARFDGEPFLPGADKVMRFGGN